MIGHGIIFIVWTVITVWLAAAGFSPIEITANAAIAAANLVLCLLALRRDLAH